jgi:hypothetical protein
MTKTLRERLVDRLYDQHKTLTRTEAHRIVETLLAALSEPGDTVCAVGADAANAASDAPEVEEFRASWAMMRAGFTAMIDAVREGK